MKNAVELKEEMFATGQEIEVKSWDIYMVRYDPSSRRTAKVDKEWLLARRASQERWQSYCASWQKRFFEVELALTQQLQHLFIRVSDGVANVVLLPEWVQ